jgi:hypothetical protein
VSTAEPESLYLCGMEQMRGAERGVWAVSRSILFRPLACGGLLLMGLANAAQGADKSGYSLRNPTPDQHLRDLTTDRPDQTESPFTVDGGRFQVETNLFGYARSRPEPDGTVTDSYEIGTTNLRIGVTSNVELDLIWQPYGLVRSHLQPFGSMTQSGIGGLDVRTKINLWGNDTFEKTGTALALLPYITLPTDRHNGISEDYVQGGLIVPMTIKLSDKLDLGLNTGIATIRETGASGYHAEYLASASFAYEWSDKLGTYYEVAARFHTQDARGDVVMLGTGVTYQLNKNLQLDAGINVGVTPAADRVNPFIGLSRRF